MKRTKKKLAKAIVAALDEGYELVYVDQGDRLTDKQVDAIASGDWDSLWDESAEWESDSRADGVAYVLKEVAHRVIREWEIEDDQDYAVLLDEFLNSRWADEVGDLIAERDVSDWAGELAEMTPDVLLRIRVIDEDDAFAYRDVQPEEVLRKVGLEVTEANRRIMAGTLAECSPEFSLLLGYWIVGASVRALLELPGDTEEVTITNPHLYLGNPFTGSGFISEEPFEGVVIIRRTDLATDRQAFGYAVEEIYGGLNPRQFSAEITPVSVVPTPVATG